VLVLFGVALGGVAGVGHQVAGAETPARKITRLRAKAARVQAAIDHMNAQVEGLVEDYNQVREDLARTRAEQARTERQAVAARRRLHAARRQLGRRLWTIYTGGAPSALGQLLGADNVHDALVTTKYQEQVVGADRAAIDRVERLRREVEALAATLADQAGRQERLRASLAAKRRQIESRLAAQRRYHKRLTRQVRRAVAQERRRQERLRRRALLRRLAAERAARARAAAARAGTFRAGSGTAGAPSGAAARAVAFARSQLGKPYLWGASGPSSYDCSGLTMAAYRTAGVWLPRVSRAQWNAGPRVGLGSLAPGDLVFFASDPGNPGTIHHVGMYIGGGAMVEAPYSGASVRIASIGRSDYIGAVRPTG
jgi:cell wall-associated NlpC family hydrolase/outer membrane murein-binding lipoprotein Lpp